MTSMSGRGSWKKRPKGAKRGPEAIATVLLRASGGEPRDGAPLPPRAWHDAVGDRIARRARPMRLERKVLTVRAATSVWAQELTFLAPAIVKRLNALGFEVESLRFLVGPIESIDRPLRPPTVKTVPAVRPLSRELDSELRHVTDAKLRETIARAASANLAWQDARGTKSVRATAGPPPVTSTRPGARDPRSAAGETAPRGQTPPIGRGADRRKS